MPGAVLAPLGIRSKPTPVSAFPTAAGEINYPQSSFCADTILSALFSPARKRRLRSKMTSWVTGGKFQYFLL